VAVGGNDEFTFSGGSWSSGSQIDEAHNNNATIGNGITAVSCGSISLCAAVDNGGYAFVYSSTSGGGVLTQTTPSAPSAVAPPRGSLLGGLNVSGYCESIGAGKATLSKPDGGPGDGTNNWICVNSGQLVDLNDVCQQDFPGESAYAYLPDPDNAKSWVCYGQ
jgi:hypothetical protein